MPPLGFQQIQKNTQTFSGSNLTVLKGKQPLFPLGGPYFDEPYLSPGTGLWKLSCGVQGSPERAQLCSRESLSVMPPALEKMHVPCGFSVLCQVRHRTKKTIGGGGMNMRSLEPKCKPCKWPGFQTPAILIMIKSQKRSPLELFTAPRPPA